MEPPEIIAVDPHAETVGCDGGNGALGHPIVYYTFGTRDALDCGYCGRRFVRAAQAAPGAPVDGVIEVGGH
ncbi:MAG: zinc-finger domain-containing protein [Inquilinaceae bacterium]